MPWRLIMYFPYLRGRQFELIAIRELLEKNLIGNKIVPVIEPIKPTSTLVKTLQIYTQKQHSIALVMNPGVGDFASKLKEKKKKQDIVVDELYKQLESECITRAYLMKKNTPAQLKKKTNIEKFMIINPKRDCLDDFLEVYDTQEPAFTLLPDDRTFSRKAPNSKVIFMDRFEKAARNSDYCKNEDEFFSEDHIYYNTEGFKGFSDYSVVGAEYNESGFAPLAVAIHIVYFDKNKGLRIGHFVSDSNDDINDPAGKFGEAVKKLVNWVEETNQIKTEGLKSFIECYKTGKYPGLGTVKKYSIMHHLELMNKYLEGEASANWDELL
ncbi:MAG: sce7725 family protein [Eubacteriales bacterium]